MALMASGPGFYQSGTVSQEAKLARIEREEKKNEDVIIQQSTYRAKETGLSLSASILFQC